MENWIITGTSRGLGAALARGALRADRRLVCLARSANPALIDAAAQARCQLDARTIDLADLDATARLIDEILAALPRDASRWVLVNNAGMVDPVARNQALDAATLAASVAVNLTAPMLITSHFLAATAGLATDRRVLHISSGAGRNPMAGWSVYCAVKAGLDMHARTVKLDNAQEAHPVRIASIAPGVIDTQMQATIRASDPAAFPQIERFHALKEQGQLATADDTAARLLNYLEREDFGAREIDDIRNY